MAKRNDDGKNRVKRLVEIAEAAGWRVEATGGNHLRWYGPEGHLIHSATTPSDWRAERNIASRLRRCGLEVPR